MLMYVLITTELADCFLASFFIHLGVIGGCPYKTIAQNQPEAQLTVKGVEVCMCLEGLVVYRRKMLIVSLGRSRPTATDGLAGRRPHS